MEEMLIHAAKSGALGGKVTEDQFIQMLEQVRLRPDSQYSSSIAILSSRRRKAFGACF